MFEAFASSLFDASASSKLDGVVLTAAYRDSTVSVASCDVYR